METGIKSEREYYYDAFISYRHSELDMKSALKLHRALEGYHIPGSISRQTGIKKIKRIFRDQEELPTSNNLSDDIQNALKQSRYLIVVCSPRTPKSRWCCQEIEDFRTYHGDDRILSILIEGEPNEAFPESLCFIDESIENPDGSVSHNRREVEPLAADIRGKSLKEMWKKLRVEKLRLLSPMLGVKFDDLRHRQRERFIKRAAAIVFAVSVFFAAFGIVASIQSNIISTQSKELVQKNDELQVQISEKEKQRELADKNGKEAQKQAGIALENQKKAEENAQTAKVNEEEAVRQKNIAEDNATEAQKQKSIAEENAARAEENARIAESERNNALLNESRSLSQLSRQETDDGNRLNGIKLALEALPDDLALPDRPYVPEAISSLYYSMYNKPFQGRFVIKSNGDINDVSYAGGGKLLVSISEDSTIKVWNVTDGNEKLSIECKSIPQILAVSPDSKYIATFGSYDYKAMVWDLNSGDLVAELGPFSHYFYSESGDIEFSGNGRRLLVTNYYSGVMVFDSSNWEPLLTIKDGFGDYASAIDYSGNKIVVYSKHTPDFYVYNVSDGSRIFSGSVDGNISYACFSPYDKYLLIGTEKGNVCLFNAATGAKTNTLTRHTFDISGAVFNVKNNTLLTYSTEGMTCLWDYAKNELLYVDDEDSAAKTADFSPDGNLAIIGYDAGDVIIRDCSTWNVVARLEKHENSVFKTMFSPDGKTFTTASYDYTVRVWDLNEGNDRIEVAGHTSRINGIAFSPDGARLATAAQDDTMKIWDPSSGNELVKIFERNSYFMNVRFSRDGKEIAAAVTDDSNLGIIWVYDSVNGEYIKELPMVYGKETSGQTYEGDTVDELTVFWDLTSSIWERGDMLQYDRISSKFIDNPDRDNAEPRYAIRFGSFSNDGRKFVSLATFLPEDIQYAVWDMEKGEMITKLKIDVETGFYADYAFFSTDAKKVITVTLAGGISVWDANTGERLLKLPNITSWYTFATFSPDGDTIATGSYNGTVCLWDAKRGNKITELTGNGSRITWMDFSPDGKKLAAGAADGTWTIWRIFPDTQELIDYAKDKLQTY